MGSVLTCRSDDSVQVVNSIRRVHELPEIRRRIEPDEPNARTRESEPPGIEPVSETTTFTEAASEQHESLETSEPNQSQDSIAKDAPKTEPNTPERTESTDPEPDTSDLETSEPESLTVDPESASTTQGTGSARTDPGDDTKPSAEDLNRKDRAGDTLLHRSAAEGDDVTIRALIQLGAKVNVLNLAGQSPIQVAIRNKRKSTVRVLIESGANCHIPDCHGRLPLHAATETGDLDLVREILKVKGVSVDVQDGAYWTPLHVAANAGREELVRFLLDAGAIPNTQDSTHVTPLHLACSLGHVGVVAALTEEGRGVEYGMITGYGATVLHMAVRGGHEDIVGLLLSRCDDVTFVDAVDYRRHSALHIAARHGLTYAVTRLLTHGARINLTDAEQLTPLHKAIEGAHVDAVQALIDAGCEVNTHYACMPPLVLAIVNYDVKTRDKNDAGIGEYLRIIKMLLVAGADPFISNIMGDPALTFVLKSEMKQPQQNALQLMRTVMHYGNVVWRIEARKASSSEVYNITKDVLGLLEDEGLHKEQIHNVLSLLRAAGMCEGEEFLNAGSQLSSTEASLASPLDLRALCRVCIRKRVRHEDLRELSVPHSLQQFLSYDCDI